MSELKHYGVAGMRWGVRRSSEFKEAKIASKGKSKSVRKKMLNSAREKALLKQQPGMSAGTAKRIAELSLGRSIAQNMFVGNFGAVHYNKARAEGVSKGRAWAGGILRTIGNYAAGNIPGAAMDVNKWVSRGSIRPSKAKPREQHIDTKAAIKGMLPKKK